MAKCLVIVKDGQIVVRSTPGVETALIIDGEDVELPDDWGDLPVRVVHVVPVKLEDVDSGDIFGQKRPLAFDSESLTAPNTQVQHATAKKEAVECSECGEKHGEQLGCDGLPLFPKQSATLFFTSGLMKAPYCPDCDGNHPVNVGCDGLPKTCSCCGATYGQLHSTGCADQNPLVEGGNIVQ